MNETDKNGQKLLQSRFITDKNHISIGKQWYGTSNLVQIRPSVSLLVLYIRQCLPNACKSLQNHRSLNLIMISLKRTKHIV